MKINKVAFIVVIGIILFVVLLAIMYGKALFNTQMVLLAIAAIIFIIAKIVALSKKNR